MRNDTKMLSAVILTKNEEKNIFDCIESLSFCDEIIVIDNNSNDLTVAVAKKAGAIVYERALENNFSAQRNFGLQKATGEWVLFIDADERVSDVLKKEILYKTANNKQVVGFFLKRNDFLWGKELHHGDGGNVFFLRLGKKKSGEWQGTVHEVWDIKGKTEKLESPLRHYPHKNIDEFLRKINFYTTLRAEELYKKDISVSWFRILLYTKGKFFQNFVLKMGFLDGIEGYMHALLMSMHAFLVRAKLWLLISKKNHS